MGRPNSKSPDVTGRPADASPPHQMWNAPTVQSSAPKMNVNSIARRAGAPPERSMCATPAKAMARTGAVATIPYS
jgi:hypothetical protein